MGGRGEERTWWEIRWAEDWKKGIFAGFGTLGKGMRGDAGGGERLCPTRRPSV